MLHIHFIGNRVWKINCYFPLYVFVLFVFLCNNPLLAADINLTLLTKSNNNNITVSVTNNSLRKVEVDSVYIEFNRGRSTRVYANSIPANKSKSFTFYQDLPTIPGSYPLVVTVTYFNDGKRLSLRNVGLLTLQKAALLKTNCTVVDELMIDEGEITVLSPKPDGWRLILPEEVTITSEKILSGKKVFGVKNNIKGFSSNYPLYAIAEDEHNGKHHTGLCQGTLRVRSGANVAKKRGHVPSFVYLAQAVLFLLLTYYIHLYGKLSSPLLNAIGKYSVRMFILTSLIFSLHEVDSWLESTLPYVEWQPYQAFVVAAIKNFRGDNYNYFFQYFVDIYWLTCLLTSFFYLFYFDKDGFFYNDKYVSSLLTILSLLAFPWKRKLFWNKRSKLGLLTICVKLFYIPLLVSWVINNSFHQWNLSNEFSFNFISINAYLLALFIYVDTIIFCFGYLFESKFIKNEIKSVDPTLLGWVVCLWCYPPFNVFSFAIFDYQLLNMTYIYPEWVNVIMTCMISLLWGVFTWASLSLGFKASNLTNRGIVKKGPYAYVRHPAYTAKVLLWFIQGIFFSQFGLGILFGFSLIYVLRAWTEERHLSMDKDYLSYKKEVRWKCIPRVF